MILKTSIYYDTDEVTTKEALYAACSAVKHRPHEKGAYSHDAVLPNGKTVVVDCNESQTQIRLAKMP